MAIGVYFSPASMNKEQYEETLDRLDKAGQGSPRGRLYHACFGEGSNLMVFDIWDTQENFEKFGETLMPILAQLHIDAGQPDVMQVQNIITGS